MDRRVSSRRRARELVLRVLYQAEIAEEPIPDVLESVVSSLSIPERVLAFARSLTDVVASRLAEIDELLDQTSQNWTLTRMSSTDRNVLRAAAAELLAFHDVDARIVLDEAVSIARKYGGDDSGRFVNGILDRLARRLRRDEFEGD